jgi:SNF2 family DNA or RNA helicase
VQLRPYQERAVDWLLSMPVALLADQMRVGKTAPAIVASRRAVALLRKKGKVGPALVLVVCPAIAVMHWPLQFQTWAPDIVPHVVTFAGARIQLDALLVLPWDVVIVDEAHYVNNPLAAQSQAVFKLAGLASFAWFLTGTPVTKHAGNVWYFLRRLKLVKSTYLEFCEEFCYSYEVRKQKVYKGTKHSHIHRLSTMLRRVIMRRMRREVFVDAHEPLFSIQPIDIKPDITPINGLTTGAKADQATVDLSRLEVAQAKVSLVVAHVRNYLETNADGKQTVIFGHHTQPLHDVTEDLRAKGYRVALIVGMTPKRKRAQYANDFQAGKYDIIVANIQAGGTAISLSKADHGFFIELSWLPSDNEQAAYRLLSDEDKRPVTFDVFSVPGSVDDACQRILLKRSKEITTIYQQSSGRMFE